MPMTCEKHLYEYAVIRYMPRVEREEFINVGLIMMCKRNKWLRVMINFDERKIKVLGTECELDTVKAQLQSFQEVADGKNHYSKDLAVHERFRWLTAVRSSCITTSRPHPGICCDLNDTFERLVRELVL